MEDGSEATLRARVEALEAHAAVLATLHAYGHAIDAGDDEAWLDCFTEDGVFEVQLGGELKRRSAGQAELRTFIAGHSSRPAAHHLHLVVDPRITIRRDEADADSYFVRLDDDASGRPVVHGFGRYRDRLVRGPDERWRFVERIADIDAFDHAGRPGSWERP